MAESSGARVNEDGSWFCRAFYMERVNCGSERRLLFYNNEFCLGVVDAPLSRAVLFQLLRVIRTEFLEFPANVFDTLVRQGCAVACHESDKADRCECFIHIFHADSDIGM